MDDFQKYAFVTWLAVFAGVGVLYLVSVFLVSRRRVACLR